MLFKNVSFGFFHLVFFLQRKDKIMFFYGRILIQENLSMLFTHDLFEKVAVFVKKKKNDFSKCKRYDSQSHFFKFLMVPQ